MKTGRTSTFQTGQNSKWDNWCHLRANNPSRGDWRWLIIMVVTVVGLIAAGVIHWFIVR